MIRRVLSPKRHRKTEQLIERSTKVTAWSTLVYTIITGLVLIVMFVTMLQQVSFNKRQLDLYNISTIPQVFVELDSLSLAHEYNVFYRIKNVGNSPALGLRTASRITPWKSNPFSEEVSGEVQGDVFPDKSVRSYSVEKFKPEGTQYLHLRVDFQDLQNQKYCYKVTYYLIFKPSEDTLDVFRYKAGVEYTEFMKLRN